MKQENKRLTEWVKISKPTKRELALLRIIDRLDRRLKLVEYILTEEELDKVNKTVETEAE